jgi:ribosome-binding factor A
MSAHFQRTDRIAEMIARQLSKIIPQELKDPRLKGFITISAVKVTKDLSEAKVYFTVFNEDKKQALSILNAAASYLRSALAQVIRLRTMPQLHFIYDESLEYGMRLSRLIDEANPSDEKDSEPS